MIISNFDMVLATPAADSPNALAIKYRPAQRPPAMKFRFFLPFVLFGVCVINAADVGRPTIPANTFNIADYGAVPDGKSLNTQAIIKAIDACKSAGGGTVVIPAGKFVTGPFDLIS